MEKTWTLAKAWYYNRMDPNYRGRSAAEAREIFREVGLSSGFWFLDSAE
ncbi:MAG TPA: hypothetical protein VN203_10350 [Candidatus Acidoferrum sp.]|nr:hypothetical protein [Candidatus Acidoferrum sp.]